MAFHLPLARGIQIVPLVEERISSTSHSVDIPDLLSYEIGPGKELIEEPEVDISGYVYPWIRDLRQWTVRELKYYSQGGEIVYSGSNALAGTFLIRPARHESVPNGCR